MRMSTSRIKVIKLWKYFFFDNKPIHEVLLYKGLHGQDNFVNQIGKLDKLGRSSKGNKTLKEVEKQKLVT